MNTDTTPEHHERIPLTPQGEAYRAAAIESNMGRAERFVLDPAATPSALRRPYTKHRFTRLSPEVRLAVIRDNVTARVDDEQQKFLRRIAAQRASEREAAAAAAAVAPASTAEAEADGWTAVSPSSYVVPCAGGCGALLPARSAKPVVRFCSPPPRRNRRRKQNSLPLDVTIRDALIEVPGFADSTSAGRERKQRRRAVCAGL